MQQSSVLVRDLVLIGGGHAHALVALMWGMKPLEGVRLTVINPHPSAPYSGMLPGYIAGHYQRSDLEIDLVKLARFAGARLILGHAEAIDPEARLVQVSGGREIAWDVASIDVGIHAQMPEIEGFDAYGTGAKPLDVYAARWQDFRARALAGEVAPEVAVIGGGIAGVELALAMAHALRAGGLTPRVALIEAGGEILRDNRAAKPALARAMSALGVEVVVDAAVERLEADRLVLGDGREVASRFTVAAAGARAHDWLARAPLPLSEGGFVRVGANLEVEGHPGLFAAGDCAHLSHAPRPKAGVFAVRAAPVLYHNLAAAITGAPMRAFRPQKHYLKLISLGGKQAIAEKWGRAASGALLWRWKDRIDRKFMDKFHSLPAMESPPLAPYVGRALQSEGQEADRPLCGGCGAKVAPMTLAGALAALPSHRHADVESAPGDDAAILALGDGTRQVLTTDHLRAFTNDAALLARIATLHALGDIWAMGARVQAALLSITLPRMSEALQARTMAEILAPISEVLAEEGGEIVGGHSSMGAEMSIGLSLTGICAGAPLLLSGAQAGDALILSRPIGSGTLLAAEMQGVADGRDVAALLASLARPQGDAARLLVEAGARAMTDVTGFGLAGHLLNMCRASGLGARLELAAVPLYDGALELAQAGQRSTIWAANRKAAPVVGASSARAALLHDPQTAGGMLAALPPDNAEAVLAQLRAAGHGAALIGEMVGGAVEIRV